MKNKLTILLAALLMLCLQGCKQENENVEPGNKEETGKTTITDYGTYTIKSQVSKKFMEIAGNLLFNEKFKSQALIQQRDSSMGTGVLWQKWQVIYRTTENNLKYYALMNLHSGKFFEVPSGASTQSLQLQQNIDSGSDQQLWEIRPVGSTNYYNIINKKTGLAVTNLNASTANSAAIVQQTLGTGDQQNWIFTAIPADTYRDDVVVRFFERNNTSMGSVAFDEGTSIPLSWSSNNGKVLWVTQDAWDGTSLQSNKMFPCNYFFSYNNSILIQPSITNWDPEATPNITINSPMGRPKQICSNPAGVDWSWPGPGVEIDNKVYLHCGEGKGLTATNQSLYILTENAETLWTSERTTPAGLSGQTDILYSSGMVKSSDNYVYVFGSQGTDFGYNSNIYVARFPKSNPQSWSFWNGSAWTNSPVTGDAARISTALAATGVSYVNGKYVLVTIDCGFNCDNARNVYVSTSSSPTGPFTSRKMVYTIQEYFYGRYARYYTPSIHPEFTNGHNELLITYCLNYSACGVDACQNNYIDPYYYRVKGIRVPYSKIGL